MGSDISRHSSDKNANAYTGKNEIMTDAEFIAAWNTDGFAECCRKWGHGINWTRKAARLRKAGHTLNLYGKTGRPVRLQERHDRIATMSLTMGNVEIVQATGLTHDQVRRSIERGKVTT
jgi:hypothetical protein